MRRGVPTALLSHFDSNLRHRRSTKAGPTAGLACGSAPSRIAPNDDHLRVASPCSVPNIQKRKLVYRHRRQCDGKSAGAKNCALNAQELRGYKTDENCADASPLCRNNVPQNSDRIHSVNAQNWRAIVILLIGWSLSSGANKVSHHSARD